MSIFGENYVVWFGSSTHCALSEVTALDPMRELLCPGIVFIGTEDEYTMFKGILWLTNHKFLNKKLERIDFGVKSRVGTFTLFVMSVRSYL